MELSVVKSHIKSGQFNRFYIFTGPEVVVRSTYIQQISKVKKAPIKTFDTFVELTKYARTLSLLSSASIYVVTDDTQIISDDKLQDVLSDSRAFKNDIIVLVFNNIDKRNKFYKRFKDEIVFFEYLPEETLVKYIQKDVKLSTANCKKLISICESDYSRILLELDKFKAYDDEPDKVFKFLLDTGAIHVPANDTIFDFIDAVLRGKAKLAYELLAEAYESGEITLNILSNLYNNAKYVLQVQSYRGSGRLTDVTGLTPFQVKMASGRARVYSDEELVQLMRLTQEAELGIKSGKIEEQFAVEYVLARFWA